MTDLHRNHQGGRFAADPDDARLGSITGNAMQSDFVNQASQERFLLLTREQILIPNLGQLLSDGSEGRLQLGRERKRNNDDLRGLRRSFFCLLQFAQRGFPTSLQLCRDEPVVRIHTGELSLRQ